MFIEMHFLMTISSGVHNLLLMDIHLYIYIDCIFDDIDNLKCYLSKIKTKLLAFLNQRLFRVSQCK